MATITISDAVLHSAESVFNQKTKTGYCRLYFSSGFTKSLSKALGCEKIYAATIESSEANSVALREDLRLTTVKILPKNWLEKYEINFKAEEATAFRLSTQEDKPAKLRFTIVTPEKIAAQIEDYLNTCGAAEAYLHISTARNQKSGEDPEGKQMSIPIDSKRSRKAGADE